MDITVHNHRFHRNGVCGVGFYAVNFSYTEGGVLRSAYATVSCQDLEAVRTKKLHDPETRVLMINPNTGSIDISETMRGDHFHDDLCKYLIKAEDTNV